MDVSDSDASLFLFLDIRRINVAAQLLQLFLIHPDAVVLDLNEQIFFFLRHGNFQRSLRRHPFHAVHNCVFHNWLQDKARNQLFVQSLIHAVVDLKLVAIADFLDEHIVFCMVQLLADRNELAVAASEAVAKDFAQLAAHVANQKNLINRGD